VSTAPDVPNNHTYNKNWQRDAVTLKKGDRRIEATSPKYIETEKDRKCVTHHCQVAREYSRQREVNSVYLKTEKNEGKF
jgi:hypothetical protein